MKEKLVLKDYYGEDWSKHFSKDSTLKTLLKKLKLQCYAIENINTEEMDYRHTIVNFNMREEEGSEQIPVNLLVVAGKPTWQEMIEISFDTGTISDRKIIVYDDSDDPHGKDDWVYRRSWASWFVDGINWRHSNMWVVKTHGIKHDERKQGLFYELEFSPVTRSPGRLLRHDEELTREVFEKAEFWAVYYEYIKWNHPSLPYGIHDISDEIYRVLGEDYNITPKVSWGDRGFHVLVRTKYNHEIMKCLFDDETNPLYKHYKYSEVERIHNGGTDAAAVKINDIPYGKVMGSSFKEKQAYAADIWEKEVEFLKRLLKTISDIFGEIEDFSCYG